MLNLLNRNSIPISNSQNYGFDTKSAGGSSRRGLETIQQPHLPELNNGKGRNPVAEKTIDAHVEALRKNPVTHMDSSTASETFEVGETKVTMLVDKKVVAWLEFEDVEPGSDAEDPIMVDSDFEHL